MKRHFPSGGINQKKNSHFDLYFVDRFVASSFINLQKVKINFRMEHGNYSSSCQQVKVPEVIRLSDSMKNFTNIRYKRYKALYQEKYKVAESPCKRESPSSSVQLPKRRFYFTTLRTQGTKR